MGVDASVVPIPLFWVENGELEIVGLSSGTIRGEVTGVDLLEESAGGTGICCMFDQKLMLPNTQSINRL